MQQSKKHLNSATLEQEPQQALRHAQTVAVRVPDNDHVGDGAEDPVAISLCADQNGARPFGQGLVQHNVVKDSKS